MDNLGPSMIYDHLISKRGTKHVAGVNLALVGFVVCDEQSILSFRRY
jgi:hypothetical protein